MTIQQLLEQIAALSLPVRIESNGAVRVGDSRVTLEIVLEAFLQGETPEQVVQSYPTLNLADVCCLYAHYSVNRQLFEKYLEASRQQSESVREMIESAYPTEDLRERIKQKRA
ncbi:MAG: DUF433 domain-containing protein, partial [Fimbriimonadales bacterium]|nr:DUF433 domain-containing protein [Fimbriimonadales bacterium]